MMEINSGDDRMGLPPGFRFHPTDEELITQYLAKKSVDCNFSAVAIGEVDMNKVEPWELPWKAKLGEKEWYFFCVRDKKYPTGLRTNRATPSGYWKATGKDKEIFRGNTLVGMKKTLVFYIGRAPKGEKSNWVCHEYRLEGTHNQNPPKSSRNDWVISRVFHKTSGGKKVPLSGLVMKMENPGNESLPPLIETTNASSTHVHCFSNSNSAIPTIQDNYMACITNPVTNPMEYSFQNPTGLGNFRFSDSSILRSLIGSYVQGKDGDIVSENSSGVSNVMNEGNKLPLEEDDNPASMEHQDLGSIWTY